jgi:hypothetical protein
MLDLILDQFTVWGIAEVNRTEESSRNRHEVFERVIISESNKWSVAEFDSHRHTLTS